MIIMEKKKANNQDFGNLECNVWILPHREPTRKMEKDFLQGHVGTEQGE